MGATLLEKELLQYWSQLTIEQQESILGMIKSFVQPGDSTTIEQYNKEIDEAMKRIDAGEFYTQEEVEAMSKKW